MLTISKTLSDLTEETLSSLYRLVERPTTILLGANALTVSPADTTFTLATVTDENVVNIGDTVEFERELLFVRDKSGSPGSVTFTAVRAAFGSTIAAHSTAVAGLVNPPFPRWRVQQTILRAFTKLDIWVPQVVTTSMNKLAGYNILNLPADTMEVYRIGYFGYAGSFNELGGWRFFADSTGAAIDIVQAGVTATITPTAQFVRLPGGVGDTDDLAVTYQLPWAFSSATPAEGDTVNLPRGGDNIPASYAAAYLAARREIGRAELDNSDEFPKLATAQFAGSMIRDLWQQYYRELDEARRLYRPPRTRPFITRPRGY